MLSDSAGECPDVNIKGRVFDAEVVAIISTAFHAVVAELGLSDRDEAAALRAAGIIIKLASEGEPNPGRLKAAAMRWVTK
jgi:hypothetical protein